MDQILKLFLVLPIYSSLGHLFSTEVGSWLCPSPAFPLLLSARPDYGSELQAITAKLKMQCFVAGIFKTFLNTFSAPKFLYFVLNKLQLVVPGECEYCCLDIENNK